MSKLRGQIPMENGKTLHVWEQEKAEFWACAAYDHGPFCRLCQPVDETLLALISNVIDGNMIARSKPDGELEFKMTEKGTAAAENYVHGTPEGAQLWADIQKRGLNQEGSTDG